MVLTLSDVLVGSFTTVFGVLVGHFLSDSRERRNSFNKAAEQFKGSFWKEIEFLDKQFLVDRASVNALKRSCDVLFNAVGRHQKAVFIFREHLGCINKYRFKQTWNEYCKDGNNIHYFSEEYPCGDVSQQYESEAKALRRINKLLRFAKPK